MAKPSAPSATLPPESVKTEPKPVEVVEAVEPPPDVSPVSSSEPLAKAATGSAAVIATTPPMPTAPAMPAKLKPNYQAPPTAAKTPKQPEPKKAETGVTDFGGRR